jgi:N-acetylglucosaminyldiphosphoundecaprenol N-acetyl-beta-D-mannosaminyltransferase
MSVRTTSNPLALPPPRSVLGYPVHPVDLAEATAWVVEAARRSTTPRLVVTLNPELVVRARDDAALAAVLRRADLSLADGVGLVWAARRRGIVLPGRVPGVDLAFAALAAAPDLRVFLLGGRPGVAEAAAGAARERWGTAVVGTHHGYFDPGREGSAIAAQVGASGAQLVLAGLGEGQERFLDDQRVLLGAGVLIGVGGTLDVLAGTARRTPAWTRRLGIEWAWRVGLDRARWHRAPRLWRFVRLALAADDRADAQKPSV